MNGLLKGMIASSSAFVISYQLYRPTRYYIHNNARTIQSGKSGHTHFIELPPKECLYKLITFFFLSEQRKHSQPQYDCRSAFLKPYVNSSNTKLYREKGSLWTELFLKNTIYSVHNPRNTLPHICSVLFY